MKFAFQILLSAAMLYLLAFLFPIKNGVGVSVSTLDMSSLLGIKLYLVGGVIISLLQNILRPVLYILGIPVRIFTFGLFSLIVNFVLIWVFGWIFVQLNFSDISYAIHGLPTYLISVAIFTVFHTIYSILLK